MSQHKKSSRCWRRASSLAWNVPSEPCRSKTKSPECDFLNYFQLMANLRVSEWRKLPLSLTELCIETTLRCGQSFRWKKLRDNEWWGKALKFQIRGWLSDRSCALHGRILSLKQDSTHLHYRTIRPSLLSPSNSPSPAKSFTNESSTEDKETEDLLKHYLNLTPDLTALYEQWSSVDSNFKKRAPKFTGVRILKQDAWEALVGFICSSNNNIVRISQMVRCSAFSITFFTEAHPRSITCVNIMVHWLATSRTRRFMISHYLKLSRDQE